MRVRSEIAATAGVGTGGTAGSTIDASAGAWLLDVW